MSYFPRKLSARQFSAVVCKKLISGKKPPDLGENGLKAIFKRQS